jgi:hypothetical protein
MAKPKGGLAVVIGVGKPKGLPADEGFSDEEAPPEEEGAYPEEGAEPAPEEEAEGEAEGAYPEFTIPEGLDLSDIEPGEEKEVMCLIGKTSEGQACIKQVDGVDLAGSGVGMYGPPPAPPAGGPPPPPPGGMPPGPGGLPPELAMMAMGAPGGPPPPGLPPEGPGGPVRRRAAARGLM